MRTSLYAAAIGGGVVVALLGSEPSWVAAVAALLVFPIAAAAAGRSRPASRARTATPLAPALLTALSGGILAGLLLRLAVAAPGWQDTVSADCGGSSTGIQQLVLWGAVLIFVLALVPVGITLAGIGARMRDARSELGSSPPLSLYPLAVAASGLALIGAGFVTNCS